MASYATVAQLREILTQAPTGVAGDALLQGALDRATDIIDGQLGFSYAAFGVAAPKDVRAVGTSEYLDLPAHQSSGVTAVSAVYSKGQTSETTDTITDYDEMDDDISGDGRLWRALGWTKGQWYRVTATWGYGTAPTAIVEVCLELAVNLYGARDSKQISDVVGVEGAVGYNRALTNRQRMVIDDCRRRAGEFGFA